LGRRIFSLGRVEHALQSCCSCSVAHQAEERSASGHILYCAPPTPVAFPFELHLYVSPSVIVSSLFSAGCGSVNGLLTSPALILSW
jgi:hypothetical protein